MATKKTRRKAPRKAASTATPTRTQTSAEVAAKPALTTELFLPKTFVRITGVGDFYITHPRMLGVVEFYQIAREADLLQSMHAKASKGTITDEELQSFRNILDRTVRVVFQAPDEVISKLSDWQKNQIIQVFTELQQQEGVALLEAVESARQTGA